MPRRKHVLPTYVAIGAPGSGLTAAQQYKNTVLGVQSANLIAYWPLDETTGTTFVNAEGTAARNGTLTGVTLNSTTGPFGGAAPYWDGVNDFADMRSASLSGAWSGAELTISIWFKVDASVWTDGGNRNLYMFGADQNDNYTQMRKLSTANFLSYWREGSNVTDQTNTTSLGGSSAWNHVVITVSESNDRMISYANTTSIATQTGLGAYVGTLDESSTYGGSLGSWRATSATFPWDGYLAHLAVWNVELTAAEITTLYNGGPS